MTGSGSFALPSNDAKKLMKTQNLGWAIFAFSSITSFAIHIAHIFAPSPPPLLVAVLGAIGTFAGVALIVHASMRAKPRIPPGGKTALKFIGLILVGLAGWLVALVFPIIGVDASMALWSPAIGISIIFGVTGLRRMLVQ